MNVLLWVIAFAIAFVVSVLGAFTGLGATTGPDIGFAGGGIWLFLLPGILLGLAIPPFFVRRLPAPRVAYVVLAGLISGLGGMIPAAIFAVGAKASETSTTVFVPAPDFSAGLEIRLAASALAGERIPVEAIYREGPFQQVTYGEFLRDRRTVYARYDNPSRPTPPPAERRDVASRLIWRPNEAISPDYDPLTRTFSILFRDPGTYDVQATFSETVPVESNVVSVIVRAPEYVYVPAAGYSATLEIAGPAAAVLGQPWAGTASFRHGPWERIRFRDLQLERYAPHRTTYRLEPPPADDAEAARDVMWFTRTHDEFDQAKGPECRIRFRTAQTFQVLARAATPSAEPIESNVLEVTVRPQ